MTIEPIEPHLSTLAVPTVYQVQNHGAQLGVISRASMDINPDSVTFRFRYGLYVFKKNVESPVGIAPHLQTQIDEFIVVQNAVLRLKGLV